MQRIGILVLERRRDLGDALAHDAMELVIALVCFDVGREALETPICNGFAAVSASLPVLDVIRYVLSGLPWLQGSRPGWSCCQASEVRT